MKTIMTVLTAIAFMMPAASFAHDDNHHNNTPASQWCHKDQSTGEFHCHYK